jgi:Fe-S cluster assembly protein SufD
MQKLLEEYWQDRLDPKDLLLPGRKRAWDHFQELGLPKAKQEAFQYLPLQKIAFPKPAERRSLSLSDVTPYILEECKNSYLVFVDGFFEESLSQVPKPLICLSLEAAMRSYGLFLQNRLSRTLKEEKDPFAVLNRALQSRGVFLYAPPQFQLPSHLQILHVFTSDQMTLPRLEVYLGKSAHLQLIQTAHVQGATLYCNGAIDAVLEEGSFLSFCDAQKFPTASQYFHAFRASLKRDSRLEMRAFTRGAALARHSVKVQLMEENTEALLQGLWNLDGELQTHVHACVEHLAPHTRSRQHFKGVLKGKSRSSFEGKILVRSIAQKTEAYQLNHNLILSDEASANAKPNLEIFADDVKASHGATISQLDAEQLFYLCSRGLPLAEAKQWLIKGFCGELIDQAPLPFLRELLFQEIDA